MAFVLLIIGIFLMVSAVRNSYGQLLQLIVGDFTNQGNFTYWVIALLIVGAVGYVKPLKGLSDGFLALIIIVLLLSKGNPNAPSGGFFQQLTAQLKGTTAGSGTTSAPSTTTSINLPGIGTPATTPIGGH